MSQAWKHYRSAPPVGTRVIADAELTAGQTVSVSLEGEKGRFPLLLLRVDGAPKAYVNACPHQYLPLDHRGRNVLSQDGQQLRCSNHDATFCARSGEGIGGLGLGCALDPVPITNDGDGWLVVGD